MTHNFTLVAVKLHLNGCTEDTHTQVWVVNDDGMWSPERMRQWLDKQDESTPLSEMVVGDVIHRWGCHESFMKWVCEHGEGELIGWNYVPVIDYSKLSLFTVAQDVFIMYFKSLNDWSTHYSDDVVTVTDGDTTLVLRSDDTLTNKATGASTDVTAHDSIFDAVEAVTVSL